jgi:NADH:ubiquinone oxidoreductase subunit E
MDAHDRLMIDTSIRRHNAAAHAVVVILQDIQTEKGYVSEEAMRYVSARLGIPASRTFAVATFYSAFSLKPLGRNRVHVCLGTACHIQGAGTLSTAMRRQLKIAAGETTADRRYSLHEVRCLGCCALAPVVKINDDTPAQVSQDQVSKLLETYT